ncbi:MAG TPA: dihydrodipicolinate synthase family protein, partial [Aequorivita sp.]|nr:dihydrodipicolinate synthase family protein [Aequorivita sp.]
NVPQNTKIHIDLKAVEKLKKTSNIVGIKDSSGNWDYLQELILAFQDEFFKVFVGNAKNLYAAYTAGAAGSITPVSNLDPKAETVMYDNIVNGDLIQALENQKRALKIASLFEYEGLPVCVKAKAAMALMGLCKNRNLKPLPQVASKDIEEVKNVLLELGLL